MKVLALLLLAVAVSASWVPEHYQKDSHGITDVQKQEHVLHILYKVYEPIRERFTYLKKVSESYNPSEHSDDFEDGGDAAKELNELIKQKKLLPKREIFSLFNDKHREEAIKIFDVLIFSRDWVTFISSAAYYREIVNEGEFVYAFYTAIIHSKHAVNIVAPPLYEITPHFFTTSEVINLAYEAKMKQEGNTFVLNFTGSAKNPEQRVAYFGEDIGLNVHHVTWHQDFPFWWQDGHYDHHLDRKGELFFWAHHQLNARYDAERLSNYLNFADELDWNKPIRDGFAPHITYKYGGEFPSRPDHASFEDVEGISTIGKVDAYETRIRDAIAHGYVEDKNGKHIDIRNVGGIEIIGDLLESSENSVNKPYYGSLHNLAHIILGRQGDPHGKYDLPPSALEHFETATRDPAFFRLHKHLDAIFKQHKDSLPPYKKSDVEFTGVALEHVSLDKKLVTYFEDFVFDLLMAVDDTEQIEDVPIHAKTKRINHEEFTYTFKVANNAGSPKDATFRVYLVPTHDNNGVALDVNQKFWSSIELDKFWHKLVPGENTVERKSSEASTTVPDPFSYSELEDFVEKKDLSKLERSCGIPNRFLLPKGKPEGLNFELVVVVTDAEKDGYTHSSDHGHTHAHCGVHGEAYPEKRPLGYPFDRHVDDEDAIFGLSNVFVLPVTITHHEHH